MSLEFFIDMLKQLNISYSISKKFILIHTPKEVADEAVSFPIELDDSELLLLMTKAHERNITFNELCNQVLREEIEKLEKSELTKKTKKNKK